jgi:short-subunit dehydrogenase
MPEAIRADEEGKGRSQNGRASPTKRFIIRKYGEEAEMAENNKRALVTGASSGIGRETATRLAEKGFEVIVAARRMDRLSELAGQYDTMTPRQVDLSDPDDVERFCEYLLGLPSPLSVLVNNAGYSIRGALEDVSLEAALRLFQVNLFSLMRVTQACLPGMRRMRSGTIVNISSMVGKLTFPGSGVYAATKHAVEAITDSLRMELRPLGIRVVAIRPGFIATEFNDVANEMTGDLMARTDPDYQPIYQTSGANIGKLFVGGTVTGPEVIADLVMEAVVSDAPKAVYSGGFLSEEFLGERARLDDDAFDGWFMKKLGLSDLEIK